MLTRECRLLKVVATVPHGAVLPIWVPAPLDGVLASVSRNRRLAGCTQASRDADHHVERLPLTRVHATIQGNALHNLDLRAQWSWAATCATWDDHGTDLRHVHQRWDTQAAERVVDTMPANPEVGRFKQWRIPLTAVVTDRITWWCVGDRDKVADLLDWRVGVGAKKAAGEGVVTRWDVTNEGAPDITRILWQDGVIARPIAARGATALGVPGCDTIPHTIRPPYIRPPQTPSLPGEGFRREQRDVIAPWTKQPC